MLRSNECDARRIERGYRITCFAIGGDVVDEVPVYDVELSYEWLIIILPLLLLLLLGLIDFGLNEEDVDVGFLEKSY